MLARDYRDEAQLRLQGKWGPMALLELIASAVVGGLAGLVAFVAVLGPLTVSAIRGIDRIFQGAEATSSELTQLPASLYVVLALGLLVVGAAASLMLAGLNRAGVAVARGKRPHSRMLFDAALLPRAVAMNFVRAAIVLLGTLLLVAPGVMAAYRYAMADYLLVTQPNLGPIEALRLSARRMEGRKRKLFGVQLFFLLKLVLLSALPMGLQLWLHAAPTGRAFAPLSIFYWMLVLVVAVINLFLSAWMQVTVAIFFRRIDRPRRSGAARPAPEDVPDPAKARSAAGEARQPGENTGRDAAARNTSNASMEAEEFVPMGADEPAPGGAWKFKRAGKSASKNGHKGARRGAGKPTSESAEEPGEDFFSVSQD